jgi:hypothetical protein
MVTPLRSGFDRENAVGAARRLLGVNVEDAELHELGNPCVERSTQRTRDGPLGTRSGPSEIGRPHCRRTYARAPAVVVLQSGE